MLLMGDFEVGPSVGGNVDTFQHNYDVIEQAGARAAHYWGEINSFDILCCCVGYLNAYLSVGGDGCTVCANNPLNNNANSSSSSSSGIAVSHLVDHIFIKHPT